MRNKPNALFYTIKRYKRLVKKLQKLVQEDKDRVKQLLIQKQLVKLRETLDSFLLSTKQKYIVASLAGIAFMAPQTGYSQLDFENGVDLVPEWISTSNGAWSTQSRVFDIDNDGDNDLMLAGDQIACKFYKSDGAGNLTFFKDMSNGTNRFFGTFPVNIDGDSDIDLVCRMADDKIQVYKNDGSGNFSVTQTIGNATSYKNDGAEVGDIDGDGDVDIISIEESSVRMFKNDGTGSFSLSSSFTSPVGSALQVALVDLDRDGYNDLVLAAENAGRIYKNNGSGGFSESGSWGNVYIGSLVKMDFNNDGYVDVWARSAFSSGSHGILTNNGTISGSWASTSISSIGTISDIDTDGDLDYAQSYDPKFYINNGSGGFTQDAFDFSVPTVLGYGYDYGGILTAGDLDGDGDIDVIASGEDYDWNTSEYVRRIQYFENKAAVAASGEITLKGNGVEITDGDATPSLTDDTDFGSVTTGIEKEITYVIVNDGTGDLTISTPLTISGTDAGMFTISQQPIGVISAAGTSSFKVKVLPTKAGTLNATITIANDDTDEGTYDFAISATGVCPTITASINEDQKVSCPGGNDGELTASASGGTEPYSYSWDNSEETAQITGLTAKEYTVQVTDNYGCTDDETITLGTVPDITDPTIDFIANKTVNADASCQAILPDYTDIAVVNDNCDTSPDVTQSPLPGTVISGTTTVTLTVADASGNDSFVTFDVNIVDIDKPTIDAITKQELEVDANCEASLPDYTGLAVVDDNCDGSPTVTQDPLAGTTISSTTQVTLTVTDGSGNNNTTSFDVVLTDKIKPDIATVLNQELTKSSSCDALLPDYTGLAVVGDNCDASPTVTQDPIAGSVLNSSGLVTLYVEDASGNQNSTSFNVTLLDKTAPIVDPIANQDVNSDESCTAQLPDFTGLAVVADNCDQSPTVSQTPAPGTAMTGDVAVTLKATDASGNFTNVSFNAILKDIIKPTIAPIDFQTVNADEDCVIPLPDFTSLAVVADNCDPDPMVTQDPVIGSPISANTMVTLTVTDKAGNKNSTSFDINFVDDINPTISPIANQTESAGGTCQFNLPDYTGIAVVADNCDATPIVTQDPIPGTVIIKDTEVTLTVTDASGNSAKEMFTVELSELTQATDITVQPQAENSACEGETNITIGVEAVGTGTITYQWYNASGMIPDAESNTYAISTELVNAGNYYCIVGSECGADVQSNDASITINTTSVGVDTQEACDTYTWIDGNTYTESNNTATYILENMYGCDSTVTLDLTIKKSTTGDTTAVACDSFEWYGVTYTESGMPTHTIVNAAGCDSIVTLNLTINKSTTGVDTQVACDTYTWIDGNTYTESNNTATFALENMYGCDSIVTLDLTIKNSNVGDTIAIACKSFEWYGETYTESGTATHTFTNAMGCDSIVTLDLTINHPTIGTDTQTACDTYTWIDGNTYTESNNTATFALINAMGCDSIVTLDLTIINSSVGDTIAVACDSFEWYGVTFTESATPTHTFTNAMGCDSVVTLDLTINKSNTGDTMVVACGSFEWYGETYTESGTATHTFTNITGCDSIVTLNLTIAEPSTGTDVQTACDSLTWIDGNTYTESNNTATFVLENMYGCDSIVTLDLTINKSVTNTDEALMCEGDIYQFGTQSLTEAGTYTEVFQTSTGCDSIVTLTLTTDPATKVTVEPIQYTSLCEGSENIWLSLDATGTGDVTFQWYKDGKKLRRKKESSLEIAALSTSSGIYYCTVGSYCGADVNTIDAEVVVNIPYAETVDIALCEGDSYQLGDQVITETGLYTEVFTSEIGCDSSVTANVIVSPIYTITKTQTVTAGESYQFGSQTLQETGDYTEVFTSVNGCDSTVTLNFVVLPEGATFTELTEEVCESYTFAGMVITQSGTYYDTLQTTQGGDSIIVLDLTIHPTYTIQEEVIIPFGQTYTLGTQTLSETGDYTEAFTSINGCDSTVTLNLTVLPEGSKVTEVSETTCGSYTFAGTEITETGTYYDTLQTAQGGDSIVILQLIIHPEYMITSEQIVAFGETFEFGSQTLSASGEYSETFSTTNSCDSIVTLHFTVLPEGSKVTKLSETACGTYSFAGSEITESGTYYDTLQTVQEGDSIIVLELVVNSIYSETITETINEGETFQFGTQSLSKTGEYSETYTSVTGCDSTITLLLVVNNAPEFIEIPAQEFAPGATTLEFNLNDFLSSGTVPEDISWSISQGTNLNVTVSGSLATITLSDESWVGTESLTVTATDKNGLITSVDLDITVTDAVSVNRIEKFTFIAYPNPTNGEVTIESSSEAIFDYTILSANGIELTTGSAYSSTTIDLTEAPNGLYFITITSNSDSFTEIIEVQ